MQEYDPLSPFEVFDGTAWEAGLLKSILDDNEIESILKDVSFLPWNAVSVRSTSMKIFVAYRDLEKAKLIVDEFNMNMKRENPEAPEL